MLCNTGFWTKLRRRRTPSATARRLPARGLAPGISAGPPVAGAAESELVVDEAEHPGGEGHGGGSPSLSSSAPPTRVDDKHRNGKAHDGSDTNYHNNHNNSRHDTENRRDMRGNQRNGNYSHQDNANNTIDARPSGESASKNPKRQLFFLPSAFEGRPPVLLFPYTDSCGAKQRPMEHAVVVDAETHRLSYRHTKAVHGYNAVINTLRRGGLYRAQASSANVRWTLLWSLHPSPEVLRNLRPCQRTNHFPGSSHLGRKDLLWRSISCMHRRWGSSYQIAPQGYVLPKAFQTWEGIRARQPDAIWIWKPCSQSCGRGIRVFNSTHFPKELTGKRGIIQRYIANPLLIDGYKFDLRIYVVVLSLDPLKVYVNDEGLVRLATEKFSAAPETLTTRTMHLTNYSVNKLSPAYVQNNDDGGGANKGGDSSSDDSDTGSDGETEDQREGPPSKWSLSELRDHFERRNLSYSLMFDRIKDLVIKTLIAVEGPLRAEWCKALEEDAKEGWAARGPGGAHRSSCFELYGFDVLVDDELKPWLLEVNICPSLSSGSPLDKRIKTKLVADTLTLVGLRPPPHLWSRCRDAVRQPSCAVEAIVGVGEPRDAAPGCTLPAKAMAQRGERLLACGSAKEAVALFDDVAWEIVLDSYDEDMRRGGLERIFPTATSAEYSQYLSEPEESYCNLVLRLWHEAGGHELLRGQAIAGGLVLPASLPRLVHNSRT